MLNTLLSTTDNLARGNLSGKNTGSYEDRYMAVVNRYKKHNDKPRGVRPPDYFFQAMSALFKETWEKQQDILGQIFMECITCGENGQFYTPSHITDFMAKIAMGDQETKTTVNDPCCGSGRFLISASKENPEAILYGTDIGIRCSKMAVINMFLFDLNAEIYWGNSLSLELWKRWIIRKGGYVFELECKEEEVKQVYRPVPKTAPVQLELA